MDFKKENLPQKKREHWHHVLDSSIWNEFKFREDDIIINAYQKSGTTWVQQIVAQLLWNGSEEIVLSEASPWIDCRFPSQEERLALVEKQSHRRFLKSHLPVDTMVFSETAKYLYVGRDGRDVLWSLYNHHRSMTDEVIAKIDSAPGRVGAPLGVAPTSVLHYYRDWLARDGYPWWSYWEHILSWWEIRNIPNVMLLHFADLKKDMAGEIRRIAAFLDIAIDESQWETILEHCSFEHMKANVAKYAPFGGRIFKGGGKTFMNKGTNGRWKEMLTSEEIEEYEKVAEEKLGADCAHWLSTGVLDISKNA